MTPQEAVASHQIPEKRIKAILISVRDITAIASEPEAVKTRLADAGISMAEIEALRQANLIAKDEIRLSYHGIDYISEV